MRDVEMNNVLAQLRALSARAGGAPAPAAPAAPAVDFGKVLTGALEKVNAQQTEAANLAQDFELGRADIASVMLAMQKSSVAFKAAAEVRNKMVQAYKEIMNMPI